MLDRVAFDKYFAGIFMTVLNDAAKIYESHIPEKQESWMLDTADDMWSVWIGEVGEVLALIGGGRKYSPSKARQELLDVINVSLMMVKLIDESE